MTPAVEWLKANDVPFDVLPFKTKSGANLAVSVAEELGLDPDQVFKTLVVETAAGDLLVALVPAALELDVNKLARVTASKKIKLADRQTAERATGYLKGAISPIAQRQKLATYIDQSASGFDYLYVSAGRRGYELQIALEDLVRACDARMIDLVRHP